jgi:hypothetical protein
MASEPGDEDTLVHGFLYNTEGDQYPRLEYDPTADRLSGCYRFGVIDTPVGKIPKSVTHINRDCFHQMQFRCALEFEMGSKLLSIGQNAFQDTEINQIVLPPMLRVIEEVAFKGCSVKNIRILSTVLEHVGKYAFSGCTQLEDVNIPASVEVIFDECFYNCAALTRVEDGGGVRVIKPCAFMFCWQLLHFEFSQVLERIGDGAFSQCRHLLTASLPQSLEVIGDKCFLTCSALKMLQASGVRSIGARAFAMCSSLSDVTLSDMLEELGGGAFRGCTSLREITLGESIKIIPEDCFRECSSLQAFAAGASVVSIGDHAFSDCSDLQSVLLPHTLVSIGSCAFVWCDALDTIAIPDTVVTIGPGAFYGSGLTSITIPFGVHDIDIECFAASPLTCVIFHDQVYTINTRAFDDCDNLMDLVLPDSMHLIGEYAFQNTGMRKVIIPGGVQTLHKGCFQASAIEVLYIGDGVTTIGESAFEGCTHLTCVRLPDTITTIHPTAFKGCTGVRAILASTPLHNTLKAVLGDSAGFPDTGVCTWCNIDATRNIATSTPGPYVNYMTWSPVRHRTTTVDRTVIDMVKTIFGVGVRLRNQTTLAHIPPEIYTIVCEYLTDLHNGTIYLD